MIFIISFVRLCVLVPMRRVKERARTDRRLTHKEIITRLHGLMSIIIFIFYSVLLFTSYLFTINGGYGYRYGFLSLFLPTSSSRFMRIAHANYVADSFGTQF